jgi:hypothetical protein
MPVDNNLGFMWSAQPVPNFRYPPDSNRVKPRLNEILTPHFKWKLGLVEPIHETKLILHLPTLPTLTILFRFKALESTAYLAESIP